MGETTPYFRPLCARNDPLPMGICQTSFLLLIPRKSDPSHTPSRVSVAVLFLWTQQHIITLPNYVFLIAGLTNGNTEV